MAKKVAVLAVNPVNGFGLFQYLETFFENGISYKVFAVAETKEIKTNSGIALVADDVIAHLKGHEDEFDALVFGCGDAVPKFGENAGKPYNQDSINQKIMTPKHFQKQENGAVLLTDEGRRAFLGGWQTRKQETITHPFLNEKLPWGLVPYVQALLLARTLRGDMELYPPFFWK